MRVTRALAGAVDGAMRRVVLSRSKRARRASPSEGLGPLERIDALERLARAYDADSLLGAKRSLFYPAPPPIEPKVIGRARRFASVEDISWPSNFVPWNRDIADRVLADTRNHTAYARIFRGAGTNRPAIVLVHGYGQGILSFEELFWPTRWLVTRGFDVAIPILPLHGDRKSTIAPRFPVADPRRTIEGFRQTMWDLGGLLAWLRAGGARATGVMGMSLGGYITALLATLDPELAFAVPFMPLSSLGEFAKESDRYTGTAEERAEQHRLIEGVYRCVSPFALPVLTPREGRLVVGGRADAITPLAHAERIAKHFESPLVTIDGGHLLQVGRSSAFREIARMFGRLGLLSPTSSAR